MATLQPHHVYAGVPNTTRGEPSRISPDPSGQTDDVAYACGRVAIVRSASAPLAARVFTLHTAPVTVVTYSRDGSLIASADIHGVIRLWHPATLAQKAEIDAMGAPIRDIAFDITGKFLVCVGDARGSYAKVLKVPSGGSAGACQGHTKRVIACDISPTKPGFVATGSEDMSVGFFKGPPVREIDVPKFLRHQTAFINDVRFSPDGKLLAIASSDRTVSILDAASNHVVVTLTEHVASVTGLSWSVDGSKLLTSANDKTTKMWSIPQGKCLSTVTYGSNVMDMQVGCAILPKTSELVSVSLRPEILLTDEGADKPKSVLRGHSKQIVGMAAVASKIYSADYSGLMVAWDADVGPSDVHFNGKGPTNAVCAMDANDQIVANVGQDGKIFITPTTSLTYDKPVTVKGGGVGIAVPTVPASHFSAIMVNETRLAAVDPAGKSVAAEIKFDNGQTGCSVAVSSDGSLIAVGMELSGGSGELRFYTLNGSSFTPAGDIMSLPSPPNRIAFSPDDVFIAVGEKSRRVKIYNATTRSSVTGGGIVHTARVDAICFSPDGTQIASGGMDGSVAVWPVDSEDEPIKLKSAHRSGVTGIAFSSATCIVTAGGDSCMRSWTL